MRLLAVQIDQFGQFKNQRFEFPDLSLLIIQGQNETGKTTLVTFIKYMLFGFPRRSELKPMGIDNVNEGVFGGRLEVLHPAYGRTVIERYIKKAGGQAVLYLENGQVQGEGLLKEWLHGLDLSLFEAIFCLNLDTLGELHRLKDETLQHYLFSTGMLGNSRIAELEKQLEKEAGDRFKPNGRLPIINQKIAELEELRAARLSWEKKKSAYFQMQEEKVSLLNRLSEIKSERTHVLKEKQWFTTYKALEPRLIRYQDLKQQRSDFETIVLKFPEDGLRRYESWRTQLVTLEGEKAQYDYQIQELEEKQSSLMNRLNPRLLEAREQIHHLLKEEPALNTLKLEKAKLEERVAQERSALKALMFQLDSKKDDANFLEARLKDIDTGLQLKQHVRHSLQELERLSRESDYIERELATDQAELEKVQKGSGETGLLTPEEQAEAEALLELAKMEPARKQELGWVTGELKRMRQTKAVSQRLKIGAYSFPVFGVIVFGLLAFLLSPHASNSFGVVVGGICFLLTLIFSGILWVFQRQMTDSGKAYKELTTRLSQLKEEDLLLQKERSLLDRYLNEEKERTTETQREAKRNELEHRLKAKEEEWQALQKLKTKRHHQITSWLCDQGYPLLNDVTIALDYVERMDQAKQRQYTIEQLERELKTYETHLDDFQRRWCELKETFGIEASTIEELRHLDEGIDALLTEKEQNEKTRNVLIGRVQSLNERIARFQQECYNLMEQAGVDSEEAFFQKEARVQEKKNLDKEWKELEQQLKIDYTEETLEQNLEWQKCQKWHSYSFEQLDQTLDKLEEQVETLQKQLEDWNVQIRQVEEDPNHAILPHRFEKVKDELKQEAYQWAIYRTARGLLDQAKETYKSQRLPQLLTIAEGLFQSVTAGKYKSLYYNESEGFSVESREGKLYRVETLSRGTAEQLFLSIRLALITLFDHPITLPLIIDDSFVNFDPIRLNGVMRVLQHVSNERQVLILTCHSDPPPTLFMEEWKESSRKVEN